MLKRTIERGKFIVFLDESTSYINTADVVSSRNTGKSSEQLTKETLKWMHIAIGNAKIDLQKFYKIRRKYLQLYLDEFICKLNRRYFGERLFDKLIITSSSTIGN
jgi:hypothetical protein